MKTISILTSLFILLTSALTATDKVNLVLVTLPVYHTLDGSEVRYAKRAYVGWDINNLYLSSSYYSLPYTVGKSEKTLVQDINLISVYRITLDANIKEGVTTVTISTAKAVKPKGYDFKIMDVAKMAAKAVRIDHSDQSKVIIVIDGKPEK